MILERGSRGIDARLACGQCLPIPTIIFFATVFTPGGPTRGSTPKVAAVAAVFSSVLPPFTRPLVTG